jgi:hypothetical protein
MADFFELRNEELKTGDSNTMRISTDGPSRDRFLGKSLYFDRDVSEDSNFSPRTKKIDASPLAERSIGEFSDSEFRDAFRRSDPGVFSSEVADLSKFIDADADSDGRSVVTPTNSSISADLSRDEKSDASEASTVVESAAETSELITRLTTTTKTTKKIYSHRHHRHHHHHHHHHRDHRDRRGDNGGPSLTIGRSANFDGAGGRSKKRKRSDYLSGPPVLGKPTSSVFAPSDGGIAPSGGSATIFNPPSPATQSRPPDADATQASSESTAGSSGGKRRRTAGSSSTGIGNGAEVEWEPYAISEDFDVFSRYGVDPGDAASFRYGDGDGDEDCIGCSIHKDADLNSKSNIDAFVRKMAESGLRYRDGLEMAKSVQRDYDKLIRDPAKKLERMAPDFFSSESRGRRRMTNAMTTTTRTTETTKNFEFESDDEFCEESEVSESEEGAYRRISGKKSPKTKPGDKWGIGQIYRHIAYHENDQARKMQAVTTSLYKVIEILQRNALLVQHPTKKNSFGQPLVKVDAEQFGVYERTVKLLMLNAKSNPAVDGRMIPYGDRSFSSSGPLLLPGPQSPFSLSSKS